MPSAISIVMLARANLVNAAHRVHAIAESPIYEPIYTLKSGTDMSSQRMVSRHVVSARAKRMIADPPKYDSIYAFEPRGAVASSNHLSLHSVPSHQGLDMGLD